jgi:hypothetical protein
MSRPPYSSVNGSRRQITATTSARITLQPQMMCCMSQAKRPDHAIERQGKSSAISTIGRIFP